MLDVIISIVDLTKGLIYPINRRPPQLEPHYELDHH